MYEALTALWAEAIIDGSRTYDRVPDKLKEGVKKILIEAGREDLIVIATEEEFTEPEQATEPEADTEEMQKTEETENVE